MGGLDNRLACALLTTYLFIFASLRRGWDTGFLYGGFYYEKKDGGSRRVDGRDVDPMQNTARAATASLSRVLPVQKDIATCHARHAQARDGDGRPAHV